MTTCVTFGSDFTAAKYIVHEHEKDGFKILYDLLALVHPAIASDLSHGPKNPIFEGDIHAYMTKFMNFIDYEQKCNRGYEYHEQADYVISAIKRSKWKNNLERGLNEIIHKLDAWKRSPTRSLENFPPELKIPRISHTLLSEYYKLNIDPFETNHERTSSPKVRRGMYDRNRSRMPIKYGSNERGRSRERFDGDRSYSYSNNRRDGIWRRSRSNSSRSEKTFVPCEICGGRHLKSTIGCPDFVKFMNIKEYVKSSSKEKIKVEKDRMVKERSRSRSGSVYRSVAQDNESVYSTDDE